MVNRIDVYIQNEAIKLVKYNKLSIMQIHHSQKVFINLLYFYKNIVMIVIIPMLRINSICIIIIIVIITIEIAN